jgi:hypothetical protein
VTFPVSLNAGIREVAAIQVDVVLDPSTPINPQANGRPDCLVNPAINKPNTTFTFLPAGCTPGTTCRSMRAVVIAISNSAPIPDGLVLFTCSASIARAAAIGKHRLVCSGPQASDPDANALPILCADGAIQVTQPCVGDCDGDGQVTVDEVILGVNIAQENTPLSQCPALDANFDSQLTIEELIHGINDSLNGCPGT